MGSLDSLFLFRKKLTKKSVLGRKNINLKLCNGVRSLEIINHLLHNVCKILGQMKIFSRRKGVKCDNINQNFLEGDK